MNSSETGADKTIKGRSRTLALLTIVFSIAHVDRHIVNIVLEPIRLEFELSDTQIGVLAGAAFTFAFSIMVIPFAAYAARFSRRNIVAGAIAFWSLLTALFGIAGSYALLLAARFGVGAAEGASLPASHSVISDLYGKHERVGAMAIFMSGFNIGSAIAMTLGGAVAHAYGWRVALFVVAVPGLIAALLVRLYAVEPRRTNAERDKPVESDGWQVRATARSIATDPVMGLVMAAAVVLTIAAAGLVVFLPSYLVRVHDLSLTEVGAYLAIAVGLGGAIGTAGTGRLTDRLSQVSPAWQTFTSAVLLLFALPLTLAGLLSASTSLCLVFLFVPLSLGASYMAPAITVLHAGVSAPMRPMASALLLMGVNLIGWGAGPFMVGIISDLWSGGSGLRAGMIAIQGFSVVGIALLALAGWKLSASVTGVSSAA